MKSNVVKSLFLTIISVLTLSICGTISWFYAIRQNQTSNGSFNVVQLEGDLYYSKYNFLYDKKEKQYYFSGYEQDNTKIEFTNNSILSEKDPQSEKEFQFYNHKNNNDLPNPFVMNNVEPGNRFMFLIRCKHNFTTDSIATLTLKSWNASWIDNFKKINKTTNEEISLKEAIYIYTMGVFEATDNFALNMTNNYKSPSPCTAFNELKTLAGGPVVLQTYNLKPNTNYFIPFIIEFSDDPKTYYVFDSMNGNTEYYVKKTDGIKGEADSNVYSSGKFDNLKMELKIE